MQRKLTTILAADVVGYSRLMSEDEDGTLGLLKVLRKELVAPLISEHRGRTIKLMGDGLLAEFGSVVEAVKCAIGIQCSLEERNKDVDPQRKILLRIGISLGDVLVEGRDIYGDGVNVAARLERLAPPGGICLSGPAYDVVAGKTEFVFKNLGEQQLKNIPKSIRVYCIDLNAAPVPEKETRPNVITSKPSIAVLPFRNQSDNTGQEYLAEGVAEEILAGLARVRWLCVASRISSFSEQRNGRSKTQVARELGVRYLLEGSVRRAGERVRITVQLTDAVQDHQIWAERYDRKVTDIFELQDEITATILGTIEPELGEAEQERAKRAPPDSLDAWDLYLRGQWHLYRFRPCDNDMAREYFQRAIETDPAFAASYTGLAYACHLAVIEAFSDNIEEMIDTGIGAAREAVALDEKDAMGFSVLSRVLTDGRQFQSALSAGRRGNSLNPNVAQVHFGYAFALTFSGQRIEALEELNQCAQLSPRDPNSWSFMTLRSWVLCLLGRFEDAIECARKAAEEPRSYLWPNLVLASALGHVGHREEARRHLERFFHDNPDLDPETIWHRLPFKNPDDAQLFIDGIRETTRCE